MDKAFLDAINPKHHGDRYSENLYKWLNKHKTTPLFVAFSGVSNLNGKPMTYDPRKTQCGNIYIGYGDMNDGWVNGAQLSAIISAGTKAKSWANPPRLKFTPLPNWLDEYQAKGKCHIDPSHLFYPERWATDVDARQCEWCGTQEKRITRMVPNHSWVAV